jgi:anti-anti-sigma factor
MDIQTRKDGQTLIAALQGRLDAVTAKQFDEAFAGWVAAGERRFLFSLAHLDYISSAGLRCFLAAAKQLKAAQGQMVLCGLVAAVAEVFRISGFDTLLTIRDTEAAALQEMG